MVGNINELYSIYKMLRVIKCELQNENGKEGNQSTVEEMSNTKQDQKPPIADAEMNTSNLNEFVEVVTSTKTVDNGAVTTTQDLNKPDDVISMGSKEAGIEEDKNTDEDILMIDRQAEKNKTASPPTSNTNTQSAKQEVASLATSRANMTGKDLACSLWIRNITTNTKAADLKVYILFIIKGGG